LPSMSWSVPVSRPGWRCVYPSRARSSRSTWWGSEGNFELEKGLPARLRQRLRHRSTKGVGTGPRDMLGEGRRDRRPPHVEMPPVRPTWSSSPHPPAEGVAALARDYCPSPCREGHRDPPRGRPYL